MSIKNFLRFLKPLPTSVALFVFLAFICVGGAIQSYAFIDGVPGFMKPSLYDELKPLCLWIPWIILALPVHLAGYALKLNWLIRYFPAMGSVAFPIVSVIYSYVLASWCCHVWRKQLDKRHGIYLVLASLGLSIFFSVPGLLVDPIYTISCIAFLVAVFSVYLVSLYGLIRFLKKAVKIS